MPADDALRPYRDQVPAPVAAERADHDPEEFVAGAETRPLPGRPGQHRELLTEQEIFGDQCLAVAHGRTHQLRRRKRYSSIAEHHAAQRLQSSRPTFCTLTGRGFSAITASARRSAPCL